MMKYMHIDGVAIAQRILKALKDETVPHRQDALELRLLFPLEQRVRPLPELAQEVVDRAANKPSPPGGEKPFQHLNTTDARTPANSDYSVKR